MTPMIRVGVYGAGRMGAIHARGLAALDEVAVVGVADADERLARGTAAAVDATPCQDLEALLELHPDGVVIAVPNHLHAAAAVTVMERGGHVFCEKPMATTLHDAQRVLDTVGRTRKTYQIGFNRRFAPAYVGLRELAAGAPAVFSGTMKMNDGDMKSPPWFSNPAISGGFIYDTGIHLLDAVRWILGMPDTIRCLARSSCYPDLDDAAAILTFPTGTLLTFSTCGHATWNPPLERVELYGDHVSMRTEGFEQLVYTPAADAPARTQDFSALPVEERLGYAQEVRAFIASLRDGRAALVTAEDAYEAVKMVAACYRSAEAGGQAVRTSS